MLSYSCIISDLNLVHLHILLIQYQVSQYNSQVNDIEMSRCFFKNLMAKDNLGATILYFYESEQKQVGIIDFLPPYLCGKMDCRNDGGGVMVHVIFLESYSQLLG